MTRHDNPDPRLASPIEPAIKESTLPHRNIWRDDWVQLLMTPEINYDGLLFHAFGGAI